MKGEHGSPPKRPRGRTGRTGRILVLAALGLACVLPCAAEPEWGGYYEGQVTGWQVGARLLWRTTNRLRLNLAADMGYSASAAAHLVFATASGLDALPLEALLPEEQASALEAALGPGAAAALSLPLSESAAWCSVHDAFVTLYPGSFLVRVGRQQLPWGTGYAWNPTDVFSPKDLFEPTYERPGVDAVKAEWGFGESGALTLVWLPDGAWPDTTRAARFRWGWGVFDASLSWIEHACVRYDALAGAAPRETRRLAGADLVGQVLGLGVWAEGAYVLGPGGGEHGQAVGGADYTFDFQTTLMLEYFHDDAGRAGGYRLADWLDLAFGNRRTLGRDYLMARIAHPVHPFVELELSAIANLRDGSSVWLPGLIYTFSDNLELTLSGAVFAGGDTSEYGAWGDFGFLRGRAYF